MEHQKSVFDIVNELRMDCAHKQKKGLHFILASVVIWTSILIIHMTSLPLGQKNFLSFCCSAPLMPLAWLFSKLVKADFSNKENPLTALGILFAVGQFPYLLIAIWAYADVPNQMLMVYAMIFGAHLLPYGWLYQSKLYYGLSGLIPVLALIVGLKFQPAILGIMMVLVEIVFCIGLAIPYLPSVTAKEQA